MMTVYWQPLDTALVKNSDLLHRQVDGVFDQSSDPTTDNDAVALKSTELKKAWTPAVDLVDTPKTFELRVLLPGINSNSLNVQATRQSVAVSGDRPSPALGENHTLIGTECAYGEFQRVLRLPAEIYPDQIQADFQQGVLCLTLPKADVYHKVSVQLHQHDCLKGDDEPVALEESRNNLEVAFSEM